MKTLSILLVVLLCLFCGCTKPEMCGTNSTDNDPLDSLGLPFTTTTGENTFGCLINGEPWRPGREGLFGGWVYNVSFTYGVVEPGYFAVNMFREYEGEEPDTLWVTEGRFDLKGS